MKAVIMSGAHHSAGGDGELYQVYHADRDEGVTYSTAAEPNLASNSLSKDSRRSIRAAYTTE